MDRFQTHARDRDSGKDSGKVDKSPRTERQERLLDVLMASDEPVTGSELAERCHVTRQVVVHDIAILRASNIPIVSTPRGYWYQKEDPGRHQYLLAVSHPPELTERELTILVDSGIHVVDVMVEHPIYGEIRGSLHLDSRRDVRLFLEQVRSSGAALLSSLTDGHHIHTVEFTDPRELVEAIRELRSAGIQVFDEDHL